MNLKTQNSKLKIAALALGVLGLLAVLSIFAVPPSGPGQLNPVFVGGVANRVPTGPDLNSSLAHYWKLDSLDWSDAIGSAHLTDNNGVTGDTGKISSAAVFDDALSQVLSVAPGDMDVGAADFSISGWFYLTDNSVDRGIVGNTEAGVSYFFVYQAAAARMQWYCFPGPVLVQCDVHGDPALSTWIHFVVGRSNNFTYAFLNGVAEAPSAISGALDSSTTAFTIGANNTGDSFWQGRADEVAFYTNRWLSATNISDIFNGGSGRRPSSVP